jgi:hypothetical protein
MMMIMFSEKLGRKEKETTMEKENLKVRRTEGRTPKKGEELGSQ